MQRNYEKENQEAQLIAIERATKLSAAFQRVFEGDDGKLVLESIKNFCFGDSYSVDFRNINETSIIAKAARKDIWQFVSQMLDEEKYEMNLKLLKNAKDKT
jgi:predicted PolB exonuclease-like 3'-5' exonuclease